MDLTKPSEKYNKAKFYDASGEKIQRKAKFCPKCGPGIFMAEHKDRYNCGACGYTEMKGAKPEVKEAPKTEPLKSEEKKDEVKEKPKDEDAPKEEKE